MAGRSDERPLLASNPIQFLGAVHRVGARGIVDLKNGCRARDEGSRKPKAAVE